MHHVCPRLPDRSRQDNGSSGGGHTTRIPVGFTLLEMLVVLIVGAVLIGLSMRVFAGYHARTASQRAAQVFARDLSLARGSARRGKERVVIRFDEFERSYSVTSESGRQLAHRSFGPDAEIPLSEVDLALTGDSVVFDDRGLADLVAGGAQVGSATFTSATVSWEVVFNAMGAARVAKR